MKRKSSQSVSLQNLTIDHQKPQLLRQNNSALFEERYHANRVKAVVRRNVLFKVANSENVIEKIKRVRFRLTKHQSSIFHGMANIGNQPLIVNKTEETTEGSDFDESSQPPSNAVFNSLRRSQKENSNKSSIQEQNSRMGNSLMGKSKAKDNSTNSSKIVRLAVKLKQQKKRSPSANVPIRRQKYPSPSQEQQQSSMTPLLDMVSCMTPQKPRNLQSASSALQQSPCPMFGSARARQQQLAAGQCDNLSSPQKRFMNLLSAHRNGKKFKDYYQQQMAAQQQQNHTNSKKPQNQDLLVQRCQTPEIYSTRPLNAVLIEENESVKDTKTLNMREFESKMFYYQQDEAQTNKIARLAAANQIKTNKKQDIQQQWQQQSLPTTQENDSDYNEEEDIILPGSAEQKESQQPLLPVWEQKNTKLARIMQRNKFYRLQQKIVTHDKNKQQAKQRLQSGASQKYFTPVEFDKCNSAAQLPSRNQNRLISAKSNLMQKRPPLFVFGIGGNVDEKRKKKTRQQIYTQERKQYKSLQHKDQQMMQLPPRPSTTANAGVIASVSSNIKCVTTNSPKQTTKKSSMHRMQSASGANRAPPTHFLEQFRQSPFSRNTMAGNRSVGSLQKIQDSEERKTKAFGTTFYEKVAKVNNNRWLEPQTKTKKSSSKQQLHRIVVKLRLPMYNSASKLLCDKNNEL